MAGGNRIRLACEITAERVIAARASERGDAIESWSSRSLPAATVAPSLVNPNVGAPQTLAETIAEALSAVGGRGRDVVAVLPDASVRVVLLDFDALPERPAEAAAILRFRLKKSMPFDIERAALSYQPQPVNGLVRVVAAVAAQPIVEEYESAFRAAGYSPGVVLPSILASLGPVEGEEPTLLVKVDTTTSTMAIVDRGELRLVRTMENPRGAALDSRRLAEDVYPSLVFFQDTYGTSVSRVLVAGIVPAEQLREALEPQTGARVEELRATELSAGSLTGSTLEPGLLAGVVGALVSR